MTSPWQRLARGIRPNSVSAFVVALFCAAVATAIRGALSMWDGNVLPFAAHFPAVLISAWLAGTAAGIAATALSILAIWFFIDAPHWSFHPLTTTDVVNYLFFSLSCALIIWLADASRRTFRRQAVLDSERQLLLRELEHRGRNTFAVVQAIVTQSLEGQGDLARTIVGRIHTVSSTNDVVTNSVSHSAGLDVLLARELGAFGRERYAIDGPRIAVGADLARTAALVFHEMATNAVKYGALSNKTGRIDVTMKRDGERVEIDWVESGGPKVVKPTKSGFGTKLVLGLLRNHGGGAEADFRETGFRCKIRFNAPPL